MTRRTRRRRTRQEEAEEAEEEEEKEEEEKEEEATDIKSNNPHLAGGEQWKTRKQIENATKVHSIDFIDQWINLFQKSQQCWQCYSDQNREYLAEMKPQKKMSTDPP